MLRALAYRPNNARGASYGLGAQGFNPQMHSERYFNNVPLRVYNGAVEGPYQRPAFGTFGNIRRASLNLFNHPNLGQPSSCVDCGSSSSLVNGIVASQNGSSMRILQFAGKFQF